jgi:hypothetical protein
VRCEENQVNIPYELSDEDQEHIRRVFHEEVVPKLTKLDARLGSLGCEFAGERFKNWTARFKSVGNDFEIVELEYDEDGAAIDLDV